MTSEKLGENISREWSEDIQAPELWDALQRVKSEAPAGLRSLERIAYEGSSLAQMYLGHMHIGGRHHLPEDVERGEYWLRRSAEGGSIEGAYLLAGYLLRSGRHDEAISRYKRLADLEYSPAMFVLGWQYHQGEAIEKNMDRAIFYFKQAEEKGHFFAAQWLSHIFMRSGMGPLTWLRGATKRIALTIPFVCAMVRYPNSDRLRR